MAEPERFLPLTETTFEILLSLASRALHGYAIMTKVNEQSRGEVRLLPGTLYRSLARLEEQGLVAVDDQRPRPERDDQRRVYYRLTPLGRQVLTADAQRIERQVQTARAKKILSGGETA